jgi:predicted O-linked N-acetylglucosamine transferase (SPINDLY family)
LAENPADLHSVREKVVRNRPVRPLFDTPRFVRNLEKAFEIMWEKYCKGEKPSLICIEEG